ncbi:MAG: hypothetical protein D6690_16965 [Nitrospirae bacterium]|nr:MAG: hypothetical protein D6690_16965 [Nitrospirota bacterium]
MRLVDPIERPDTLVCLRELLRWPFRHVSTILLGPSPAAIGTVDDQKFHAHRPDVLAISAYENIMNIGIDDRQTFECIAFLWIEPPRSIDEIPGKRQGRPSGIGVWSLSEGDENATCKKAQSYAD